MKCLHGPRAVCWLCSWDAQPWWPEARRKAIADGTLRFSDLHPRLKGALLTGMTTT